MSAILSEYKINIAPSRQFLKEPRQADDILQMGARYYSPRLSRFISRDHQDPNQTVIRDPIAETHQHVDANGERNYRNTVGEFDKKGTKAWKFWYPCTKFACKAYNAGVPSSQRVKSAYFPKNVCKNIEKRKGGGR